MVRQWAHDYGIRWFYPLQYPTEIEIHTGIVMEWTFEGMAEVSTLKFHATRMVLHPTRM